MANCSLTHDSPGVLAAGLRLTRQPILVEVRATGSARFVVLVPARAEVGFAVTIGNTMERDKFQALVEQALDGLPEPFRERLTNVAIIVEDLPPAGIENQGILLGLFHGIPRTEKSVFYSSPPDHIFLYQKNIEAISRSEADVRREIRETLLHEVGHYFGLSEEELRGF
ncbi:MAG: metallopeptidase family protein [Terriglobia bacterium]|jgi:predicted Zn-dependent protease with MMP-like domain